MYPATVRNRPVIRQAIPATKIAQVTSAGQRSGSSGPVSTTPRTTAAIPKAMEMDPLARCAPRRKSAVTSR